METEDGNEDVCGACTDIGDLICCESCPAAYHAECAGYGTGFSPLISLLSARSSSDTALNFCSEPSRGSFRRLVLLVLLHPAQSILSIPTHTGKHSFKNQSKLRCTDSKGLHKHIMKLEP